MKCCAIALAISLVIEKVVVVVVVTIREGSRGSGPRLDWENLRDARFKAASSLKEKGSNSQYKRTRAASEKKDEYARGEGVGECTKKLLVCRQFQGNDKGRKQIEGILSVVAREEKKNVIFERWFTQMASKLTFRKGRPRLVVFIIWLDDPFACEFQEKMGHMSESRWRWEEADNNDGFT